MIPKFRAWYMPFGRKEKTPKMLYGKSSNILAFAEMLPDEYIVEQSTGLKDANGEEIYEGDVVQPVSLHINLKRGKPFEVKKGNYVYGKWIAKDISNKGFGVDGCYFDYEIQVVGNVHKNSKLLEAQHDTRTD